MIELFYVSLLIVFGGLIAVTLTTFGMHRRAYGEELDRLRDRWTHQEERIGAMREELEDLILDVELLGYEKASLEAQETCMRSLDKFDAALEDGENE